MTRKKIRPVDVVAAVVATALIGAGFALLGALVVAAWRWAL